MQTKLVKRGLDRGFTLVEIMVAVSIFAMVMVVGVGAVLSIVGANRKAQAFNSVLNNLNFALEGMMRDLRTGYNYDCNATGSPSDCANTPASKILFHSSQYKTDVKYELLNGSIMKTVGLGGTPTLLTSSDVKIDHLDFYVVGTTKLPTDFQQPKIVIVISGKYVGYGQEGRFSMQTTVSQRNLDISS